MKKKIIVFLSLAMIMCCLLPYNVYAQSNNESMTVTNTNKYNELEFVYAEYDDLKATGLIVSKSLGIAKSGSSLVISGHTTGTSSVIKCGFTKVIVQKRNNSNSSWSDYKTYTDLYNNSNTYTLGKSISVSSGYQYRVKAIHYAKKSLLSIQKIEATTSYLQF